MNKKYFSTEDLKKIVDNTESNNHVENHEFIAKKIHSRLKNKFKKILKEMNKVGYLPSDLSKKEYKLYQKLMIELKKKSPEEYTEIHSML